MKKVIYFLCIASTLLLANLGHATLRDRGGGLIYDDALNITWLKDAKYAQTSGYDSDGQMAWAEANTWAANLVYSGYSDWRLPRTVGGPYTYGWDGTTTAGYNITSSEMGYLYYIELGNKGYRGTDGSYPSDYGLKNTGPFENLTSMSLWSGTEFQDGSSTSWGFDFYGGSQGLLYKGSTTYAWAVRDGDVAPVPIPGTVWLLGSGLIGVIAMRRKFWN